MRRLRAAFEDEAREHAQSIASGLVSLELAGEAERPALLERVFRAAHSLKGAARTVEVSAVETVCQALESVFASLRSGALRPTRELFDVLQRSAASLERLLPESPDAPPPALDGHTRELLAELYALAGSGRPSPGPAARQAPAKADPPPAEPKEPAPRPSGDTVRVAASKLKAIMAWSDDLVAARVAAAERARRARELARQSELWRKRWSQTRGAAPGESAGAARQSREAPIEDFQESLGHQILETSRAAARDERAMSMLADRLLDQLEELALQPCFALLDSLPMTARELARQAGKEVELVVSGAEIELDRRVLEALKDPLNHLLRNCIDHGIEIPEARAAAGKARRGIIRVSVSARAGDCVSIEIADDGAGIDPQRLRREAARQGRIDAQSAERLSDDEAIALAFESGFSTRRQASDLSGRGLGLAIAQQKVAMLDGSIKVSSSRGNGTTFRLLIPATLSRFRGLVIREAGQLFVLPTRHVAKVARVRRDDISTVENRPAANVDGATVAVASLGQILGMPEAKSPGAASPYAQLALVGSERARVAFAVDEILYEEEVVVKPLGPPLKRRRHTPGAAALGDGRIAAVLHPPELLATAARSDAAPARLAAAAQPPPRRPRVLVAEDSITSRALLRAILETADYEVETAADGIEAFSKLRASRYDAVVSDVDMPRLDGFGLTTRIRADARLEELPVVLVTALESPAEREHGMEVGASAYLVKSSFDQSDLLEILHRLL